MILTVGGIISGFVFRDAFTGFGAAFMDFIGSALAAISSIELELIDSLIKAIPLLGSFIASAIFMQLAQSQGFIHNNLKPVLEGLRFYYNEVTNRYLALPILNTARHAFEG